jgi:molybdopterin converting factor small subunit
MKIEIKIIGSFQNPPPALKNDSFQVYPESSTTLYQLVNDILNLQAHEKIILVNGRYTNPNYCLKDGDTIMIFSPLAGG